MNNARQTFVRQKTLLVCHFRCVVDASRTATDLDVRTTGEFDVLKDDGECETKKYEKIILLAFVALTRTLQRFESVLAVKILYGRDDCTNVFTPQNELIIRSNSSRFLNPFNVT